MKKNRGFMFVELIIILGIFTVIIFPMIMLMNKNIKIVENIRINNEIIKTAENIENILINLSEKEEISDKYFLMGILKKVLLEWEYFLLCLL